jgi:predicted nucleic acid-binding protein
MLLEKCQLKAQLLAFSNKFTTIAPTHVMEEYCMGDWENPKPNADAFREVFRPTDVKLDDELLPYFYYESTSGEIWVISYARQNPEFTCVIDEMFARNICNLLKVKVIGTIGIIKEMKNNDFLIKQDLRNIRNAIKNCRFYLSKDLLNQLDQICDVSTI